MTPKEPKPTFGWSDEYGWYVKPPLGYEIVWDIQGPSGAIFRVRKVR